jgi:hypothetical protein
VDRRRRSGARLPSAPRTHRTAVWRRPLLPHRGPRAVERGRHAGNLRPRRPPDQAARQPDRTGRGRSRPAHPPGRQGRRGRGRRRATSGVHRDSGPARRGPVGARAPVAAARGDPVPVHRHGRAAGQREREGRLPRADPDGATRRAHHHPARALARPARTRGPGRGQQLLHERRPLSARRAAPEAGRGHSGRGSAPGRSLRRADARGPRRDSAQDRDRAQDEVTEGVRRRCGASCPATARSCPGPERRSRRSRRSCS